MTSDLISAHRHTCHEKEHSECVQKYARHVFGNAKVMPVTLGALEYEIEDINYYFDML